MPRGNWTNATAPKCKAAWDILSKIYKSIGSLPDNQTPKNLLDTNSDEILDYAELVAENNELWEKLPLIIKPSKEEVNGRKKTIGDTISRPDVETVVEEPDTDDTMPTPKEALEKAFDKYAKGETRENLRQKLRDLLNECR